MPLLRAPWRSVRLLWAPRLSVPLLCLAATLSACAGAPPETLGIMTEGTLPPCPETPNCVHTGMRHPTGTEGIYLRGEIAQAEVMAQLERLVAGMPRTRITHLAANYLRAEERSRLFRFVDDVELLLAADGELIVRSASRLGRSDMGVNGRRLERLRELLAEAGLTTISGPASSNEAQ